MEAPNRVGDENNTVKLKDPPANYRSHIWIENCQYKWNRNYGQRLIDDWLFFGVERHFQQYFNHIMATSFIGGRSRSTRREPPTMGKQLVYFITCGCDSSAPFCILQSRARTHAVLVIGLYELLGNPTT